MLLFVLVKLSLLLYYLRFLRAKQLQTKRWWLVRPTNGAFTLLLAMHTCDIVSVCFCIGWKTLLTKSYIFSCNSFIYLLEFFLFR